VVHDGRYCEITGDGYDRCRKFTVVRHYNKDGEKTNRISALAECQMELLTPIEAMVFRTAL
jgi:hypothetical protein